MSNNIIPEHKSPGTRREETDRAHSAPHAFASIGWKFYLVFIIPGSFGAIVMWLFFPATNGLPLEEIAAIFGTSTKWPSTCGRSRSTPITHAIVDRRNKSDASTPKEGAAHVEDECVPQAG